MYFLSSLVNFSFPSLYLSITKFHLVLYFRNSFHVFIGFFVHWMIIIILSLNSLNTVSLNIFIKGVFNSFYAKSNIWRHSEIVQPRSQARAKAGIPFAVKFYFPWRGSEGERSPDLICSGAKYGLSGKGPTRTRTLAWCGWIPHVCVHLSNAVQTRCSRLRSTRGESPAAERCSQQNRISD